MCQMMLVSTGNELVNKIFMINLLAEDSRLSNKDGTGFFSPGAKLLKTTVPGYLISNAGNLFRDRKMGKLPIMGHVRNASFTNGAKLIDKEHAHPFETTHFMFQHNGSLEFRDVKKLDEYKDKNMIDSQIFLAELEKNYTGNVLIDLNTTMNNFYGKFAFMFFHKPENKFYVVRGRTATLFWKGISTNGEPGILVNTEDACLDAAMLRSINILQLLGKTISYDSEVKIAAVPFESVYELTPENNLKYVGKIEETTRPVQTNVNFQGNGSGTTPSVSPDVQKTQTVSTVKTGQTTVGSKLARPEGYFIWFMRDTSLSIGDLDELSNQILEKPLISLGAEDKIILSLALEELYKLNTDLLRELWRKIKDLATVYEVYKKYPKVQFPYWLTPATDLREIYEDLKAKEEERKRKEKEKNVPNSVLEESPLDGELDISGIVNDDGGEVSGVEQSLPGGG